jgi:hypothetical protein
MLDISQIAALTILVIVAIGSSLISYKAIAPYRTEDQMKGERRRYTLKLYLLVVLLFPTIFACVWGAAWLLLNGWEGFTGFLLMTGGAGLAMGGFTIAVMYLGNIIGRREQQNLEKKMDRIIKTKRPVPTKTKTKATYAATIIVIVTIAFNVSVFGLSGSKSGLAALFVFEAFFCFILGISPVIGFRGYRPPGALYDPQVRWFMAGLIAAATILALLYVFVAYFM